VAVIGSGPAGSHVAYRLAVMGHRVVVLERKRKAGEQACCTGIIGKECVSSYAIPDSVVLRQANSALLFSPSGGCVRLYRPETQAYVVDRAAFDLTLAEKAGNVASEYLLNSRVDDVKVEKDRVRVEVICGAKKSYLEARAVVIAAGFGTPLTGRLGKIGDFVVGGQAEVETRGMTELEVYFGKAVAPGFFGWLVPTLPDKALVGVLSRKRPGHYLSELISSLVAQGKIVSADESFTYGGIPLKPLSKTYGDRVLVVGDAAGQVKPTTGGGIFYGLLCADIAVDVLHRALEADALSAGSLADYERAWKNKLGRELKAGYWARKLYERLSDRQIDKLFDIIKSKGVLDDIMQADDLSFDWHSEAILRMMRHSAVSRFLGMVKLPFRLTG